MKTWIIPAVLLGMAAPALAQHECDMSQLKLSEQQKEQFRALREQYRTRKTRDTNDSDVRRYQNYLMGLSTQPGFNENEARRFLTQLNTVRTNEDLRRLRMQYDVSKILSPDQRSIWIRSCARP